MDYKQKFAERLTTLREKHNISQQELADKLNITRQSLSLYEKAERTINIELLAKIADIFGVSTDYLMGRTETATMNENIQTACKITGLSEDAIENIRNRLVYPEYTEHTNKYNEMDYSVTIFTEDYYRRNKYIVDKILSDNCFWDIVFNLTFIIMECEALKSKFPDKDLIMEEIFQTPIPYLYSSGVNEELIEKFKKIGDCYDNIDLCRYKISRLIEKICDIFDIRINKEREEHGKHNS